MTFCDSAWPAPVLSYITEIKPLVVVVVIAYLSQRCWDGWDRQDGWDGQDKWDGWIASTKKIRNVLPVSDIKLDVLCQNVYTYFSCNQYPCII